jgi:hypothetical protein
MFHVPCSMSMLIPRLFDSRKHPDCQPAHPALFRIAVCQEYQQRQLYQSGIRLSGTGVQGIEALIRSNKRSTQRSLCSAHTIVAEIHIRGHVRAETEGHKLGRHDQQPKARAGGYIRFICLDKLRLSLFLLDLNALKV